MSCEKIRYDTRAAARAHARKTKSGAMRRQAKQVSATTAYECKRCGGWHLTSMAKSEIRRRKRKGTL